MRIVIFVLSYWAMILYKEDESYLRAVFDARILGWIIHISVNLFIFFTLKTETFIYNLTKKYQNIV